MSKVDFLLLCAKRCILNFHSDIFSLESCCFFHKLLDVVHCSSKHLGLRRCLFMEKDKVLRVFRRLLQDQRSCCVISFKSFVVQFVDHFQVCFSGFCLFVDDEFENILVRFALFGNGLRRGAYCLVYNFLLFRFV